MGARQSRRSVDITTTPKKGEVESPIEGEGKVEKIGDLESKITTNGSIHNEIEYADKEENEKDDEVVKENGVPDPENSKTPEAEVTIGESLSESTDPNEKSLESLEKSEEVVENNKKNKDKSKKKKWSFRSISFSRKDKSKPSKDSEKNGEVKEINEETWKCVQNPKLRESMQRVFGSIVRVKRRLLCQRDLRNPKNHPQLNVS